MKKSFSLLLLLVAAPALRGQDQGALSQFFEGKQVVVKLDMPGTQQGVDLYPQKDNMFDAKAYGKRMKSFPVALRNGDTVMITTVKVKDKLIEFQLGGGGFGTFGDDTDTSVQYIPASKSEREKDLENQLSSTDDPDQRNRIQRELDYLRRQRERDDQRNRAMAQQAAEVKKIQVNQDRASGGSRFNLKYNGKVPQNITPQEVMNTLAEYVSFPASMTGAGAPPVSTVDPATGPAASEAAADPLRGLQKGMSEEQVRALLGTPATAADADHDGIQVHSESFTEGNSLIRAEFVNGVLVRYSVDVR